MFRLSRTTRTVAALGLLAALTAGLLAARAPAGGVGYSPQIDEPSSYDAQRTCTKSPQPGTVALAGWLQRTYPVTGSMGMMRACRTGGTSEHKDGRAFDWAADVSRPRAKRAAYAFIRRALASDAAGNEHALARRLGIMYFIYNDTIWSSYRDFQPRPYLNSGCRTKKKCSRTLRHLNHVHISLGYAGAAAQTSWYRARGVAAVPVLTPGTGALDYGNTAVTGLTVSANGRTASSSFALQAGVTYRIVATGAVTYGNGLAGDANCTWPRGSTTFTPTPRGLTSTRTRSTPAPRTTGPTGTRAGKTATTPVAVTTLRAGTPPRSWTATGYCSWARCAGRKAPAGPITPTRPGSARWSPNACSCATST